MIAGRMKIVTKVLVNGLLAKEKMKLFQKSLPSFVNVSEGK